MDRDAWLDQQHARIRDLIRSGGWCIQYVGGAGCDNPGCDCSSNGSQPAFAYTIGMFGVGHSELVMVGADPHTTASVMNTLCRRIRDGEPLMPGQLVTLDDWPHRIIPEQVPNPGDVLLWANAFYQRPAEHSVAALQLTYDDTQGRFPWDSGYAAPELQPRPGTYAA